MEDQAQDLQEERARRERLETQVNRDIMHERAERERLEAQAGRVQKELDETRGGMDIAVRNVQGQLDELRGGMDNIARNGAETATLATNAMASALGATDMVQAHTATTGVEINRVQKELDETRGGMDNIARNGAETATLATLAMA